jgi:hypothetical protein
MIIVRKADFRVVVAKAGSKLLRERKSFGEKGERGTAVYSPCAQAYVLVSHITFAIKVK